MNNTQNGTIEELQGGEGLNRCDWLYIATSAGKIQDAETAYLLSQLGDHDAISMIRDIAESGVEESDAQVFMRRMLEAK